MSQALRTADNGDDLETEQLRAAVAEARAEVQRGDVIPHDRVREWLLDLAQGKKATAPRS
ncbi:antitoxin [Azospirillum cavernae]|uniref:Antitoxin n=1 Tax=Azospirillum cavernae TaxID=2320860 RepID=A0A418W354_9PROT|nr:antitoxin [Azospirillum cavernae]RJF84447.1 antitoxin [Azospirillum cavernae]